MKEELMIDQKQSFAYPIFTPKSDDFELPEENIHFDVSLKHNQEESSENLDLEVIISLYNDNLYRLVHTNKASIGLIVSCSNTLYFENYTNFSLIAADRSSFGQFSIPKEDLFDKVNLQVIFWNSSNSLTASNFRWVGVHDEFSDNFFIEKNAYIGYSDQYSITINKNVNKPLNSIFRIEAIVGLEEQFFKLSLDNLIHINVNQSTFNQVNQLRESELKDLLIPSLYVPVVMEVIALINQDGVQSYRACDWYQVLKDKCDAIGEDLEQKPSPFEVAQKIFEKPTLKYLNDILS